MSRQGQRPSPRVGGVPCSTPPPVRPRGGPGPPRPTQTGSCCRKPDTTGFVFWASPPPSAPPAAPRRGCHDPALDAVRQRPGPGGGGRGRGAAGTQRALCGAAGRLRPRTHTPGRNTGPRNPVAQGSGGGAGWATCPVALGRAHKAASRDSRLAPEAPAVLSWALSTS